jgi:hypothetical protein
MTAADAKQLIDKEFGEIFPEKLNVERKHNHLLIRSFSLGLHLLVSFIQD